MDHSYRRGVAALRLAACGILVGCFAANDPDAGLPLDGIHLLYGGDSATDDSSFVILQQAPTAAGMCRDSLELRSAMLLPYVHEVRVSF